MMFGVGSSIVYRIVGVTALIHMMAGVVALFRRIAGGAVLIHSDALVYMAAGVAKHNLEKFEIFCID